MDPTLIADTKEYVPQGANHGLENVELAPVAKQEGWKKFSLTKDWTPENFAGWRNCNARDDVEAYCYFEQGGADCDSEICRGKQKP